MRRPAGYVALALALASAGAAWAVDRFAASVVAPATAAALSKAALALAVVLTGYGLYLLVAGVLRARAESARQSQVARNATRLLFVVGTGLGVFAAVTEQWVGLLFSLGVVGFGATVALQQPLSSLVGWAYIVVKEPYQVGDRVTIDDSTGDVAEVDLFVTTLSEVGGDLVGSHRPSGRTVTVPNSVVLSSHVRNFTSETDYVWNELRVRVGYETDLGYARECLTTAAEAELGPEMVAAAERHRERLAALPTEATVATEPTVNVGTVPDDAWVELRLRYLVDPYRAQETQNALYERVLAAFDEGPDRVQVPAGRSR